MKKIILIYISMFILVYAQEPSYEDTVKFIEKKTNLVWTDNNTGKISKKQYIKFEQCTMYLFVEYYYKSTHYDILKDVIKLKDLDPTRFKIDTDIADNKVVSVTTKENKHLIKRYFKNYSTGYQKWHSCSEKESPCTDNTVSEHMHTLNPVELNLPKLLKALKHVSKLCGAKGELF